MIHSWIRCTGLAALALALFGWVAATPTYAKDSRTKTTIELYRAATIAGKSLKPGTYSVVADETNVKFSLDGKLMAEAPAQWKDAPTKAAQNSLVLDGEEIREIHFGGRTRFLVLSQ